MPNQNRKILVAEDNPGLARVLSFKFKSSGFEPITCGNGGEAWRCFCETQVAAVVSDHEMPIMSGIELIERVREMDATLPCFLVTGRQLELSRDPRVVQLNIHTVFGKPFSPGTVVSAVADAIQQQATGATSPLAPVGSTPLTGAPSTSLPGAEA